MGKVASISMCILGLLLSYMANIVKAQEGLEIFLQTGHTEFVTSVAISSDGRHILSGSADNTVRFWERATGKLVRMFDLARIPGSVDFSPDGNYILAGSSLAEKEIQIHIWNKQTGELVRTWESQSHETSGATNFVKFSPDAQLIALGGVAKTIELWDPKTGELIQSLKGPEEGIKTIVFSSNGRYLAAGTHEAIYVWEFESKNLYRRLARAVLPNAAEPMCLAFSPDGRSLASGGWENDIHLWDLGTGELVSIFKGHTDNVSSLAFSPDGSWLISGSEDKTIHIWDHQTGKVISTLVGDSLAVTSLVASRDGRWLVTGGFDNTVKLWDLNSQKFVHSLGAKLERVRSVAFSPDSRYLVGGSGAPHSFRIWDFTSGRLLGKVGTGLGDSMGVLPPNLTFSENGQYIASSGDKKVNLWKAETGELTHSFEVAFAPFFPPMAFSPDGSFLATVAPSMGINIWQVETGQLENTFFTPGFAESLIYTPDGKNIIAGIGGVVYHLNPITGGYSQLVNTGLGDLHALSLNSKIFVSAKSLEGSIRLFDLETRKLTHSLHVSSGVQSIALSLDNKYLAAGVKDHATRMWEIHTGKLFHLLKGHTSWVNGVAFSPDVRLLASGGDDGHMRVWDVENGRLVLNFVGFDDGEWVVYTPDNFYMSSPKGDQYVTARSGNKVYEFAQYSRIFKRSEIIASILKGEDIEDQVAAIRKETGVDPLKTRIGEFRPPEISVKYLKHGEQLFDPEQPIKFDEVELVASFIERIDGVEEVQATLNGKVIFEKKGIGQKDYQIPIPLKLEEGENQFSVVAYSKNQVRSYPQMLRLNYQIDKGPQTLRDWVDHIKRLLQKTKSWAVVIGVDKYAEDSGFDPLPYAIADANAVQEMLVSRLGFKKDRVFTLSNPTKREIEFVLGDQLPQQVQEQDRVLVFFSGHGTTRQISQDEAMGFLVPSDGKSNALYSTGISMNQLQAYSG